MYALPDMNNKLIEICNIINYDCVYFHRIVSENDCVEPSDKDIIFTQDFIKKLKEFLASKNCPMWEMYMNHNVQRANINHILNHLDDPVEYIYNLVFLWKN